MPELPYSQTFNKLMQSPQQDEFHELLVVGKQLLDVAHHEHTLSEISRNPHLRRFVDTPQHVQAFWEIEKQTVAYPRDRLAINMAQGALWISISYDGLEPNRSLAIGEHYAHIHENNPLRPQSIHRTLRNDQDENYYYNPRYVTEQLAQFAVHLTSSIDLMGLGYAVQQEVEELHEQEIAA